MNLSLTDHEVNVLIRGLKRAQQKGHSTIFTLQMYPATPEVLALRKSSQETLDVIISVLSKLQATE